MNSSSKHISIFFICLAFSISASESSNVTDSIHFLKYKGTIADETQWADSVLATMTVEQKIGQLMMTAVFGKEDAAQDIEVRNLVQNYHIGGLIFMKADPAVQVTLTNRYQNYARLPLMVAQDAEWGMNMRMPNVIRYPHNMTLGAIRNDSLLYKMGLMIGEQCKTVGVQINFAPVVDVNNNPANPVIGDRSFGENKFNVVRKAWMFSKGMMDKNILPCAKHFPGHGDTDTDSHKDLPVIPFTRQRLDTVELYTFQKMIEYGMPSMMVAHLSVPALDPTANRPSTLSPLIINDLLRKQMHYDGLVFTDALNMQGVAKYYAPGEVELLAFKAGNDVLLYSQDVPKAVSRIERALESKEISQEDLDAKVLKILKTKYRLGLNKRPSTPYGGTLEYLNSGQSQSLKKQLFEAAVTLVKNENKIVPLGALEGLNIAYVQIGGTKGNTFSRTLEKYASIKVFNLPKNPTGEQVSTTLKTLRGFTTVIVGVFDMEKKMATNFGIDPMTVNFSKQLAAIPNVNTILCTFGSPYGLRNFGTEKAIFCGYEEDIDAQQAVASAIFGGLIVDGQLPVTASPQFKEGMGETIPMITRFGFALPEELQMSSYVLNKIDSVAKACIQMRAVPGFAVAVMRRNKIVYEKGFGKTDYGTDADSIDPLYTMYDIASVTKVVATTTLAMHLAENGMLDLDKTIGYYLPEFKNSNKSYITVRELLQHTAGLKAWIPFYLDTYQEGSKTQLRKDLYKTEYSEEYSIEVAPRLYLNNLYKDSLWQKIIASDVGSRGKMVYSDLGVIITGKIIESIVGTSLDDYACTHFYQPMGMSNTMYNAGQKGCGRFCAPTEIDSAWRHNVLKGYVHDPACAMFGGVTGHAGLFSNVYDLCKWAYMIKNGGIYGSRLYLDESTIKTWTSKQVSYSRRGIGWDKPNSDPDRSGQVSGYASDEAYGHLGFTGTSVWIDPKYDLIFVFLSNRTYPSSRRTLFNKLHVRKEVMDLVYESMMKKGKLEL